MTKKTDKELAKKRFAAYQLAWKKENQKRYSITYSKSSDADVIAILDSVEGRSQYIANLVREDAKKKHD